MKNYKLYWGDFHKHIDLERIEQVIEDSMYNIDVYPVLLYPFRGYWKKGLRNETVKQRPEFLEWWSKLQKATKKYYKPGKFVTFLGYEWHGNRTRWGDHNVIYFNEENPLDDAWELEDLYKNLRSRNALVIPHHTGYMKGNRGKDWDIFDPQLSPVTEIYSSHGSSEGIGTPIGLLNNVSMGPQASGGNYIDALNRGYHIGAIASNDGCGLPGSWDRGVAGIWANDLTREAIWEAVKERRTYGVTGDRIKLMFTINEHPMGTIIQREKNLEAKIYLDCAQPLDRIELIHNGYVLDTYCHRGKWERKRKRRGHYKILAEFGWGPTSRYGFKNLQMEWIGNLQLKNGKLRSVQPRFSGLGQHYRIDGKNSCNWHLITTREENFRQGLIFEIEGDMATLMVIRINGHTLKIPLKNALLKPHLFPFVKESIACIKNTFGIEKAEIENPDVFFCNAGKVKIHPAYPKESYAIETTFNLPAAKNNNYYYVRAYQIDGQMAWSSPIWVETS